MLFQVGLLLLWTGAIDCSGKGYPERYKALDGRCSNKLIMYSWFMVQLCFNDKVTANSTGNDYVLGTAENQQWLVSTDGKDTVMYYDGDAYSCPKKRQVKIKMMCGATFKMVKVAEPGRCEYYLEIEAKEACEKGACDICDCSEDVDYGGVEVDCYSRGLTRVPKDLPHDTTTLNIESNQITLRKDDFNSVAGLKSLSLGWNKITSLPTGVFDHLGQLEQLGLHYNNFVTFPPHVFDRLKQLSILFLEGNHLSSLPVQVFAYQVHMVDLYLSDNPLTCSCDLFHTLVEVVTRLENDDVGTCDGDVDLLTMTRDKEERFCGKKTTTPIPTTTPKSTTTPVPTTQPLTTKSTDACHICSCEKDFTYGGIYVGCRNRRLTSLPTNLPETTTTLNLFHNGIKTITSDDFNKLKKLKYLNLSRNKLVTLPGQAFRGLSQLERLTMADNKLSTIESRAFDSLIKLKEVALYGNKLTSLPMYLFEETLDLTQVDLSDNALQCNCALYHVLVNVVKDLGERVSGTCKGGGDVELSTITRHNKHKFCKRIMGKR